MGVNCRGHQSVAVFETMSDHVQILTRPKKLGRVSVALSGGYSREEANRLLALNSGVIASFSRALAEGLTGQQSDAEFDAALNSTIQSIYDASVKAHKND